MASSVKQRSSLVKYFISVAKKCTKKLNNFNTMLEITAGLNMAPVRRLKKTWLAIPSKSTVDLEELERLMDHRQNYKTYRETIKNAPRPCLPYFGIFLRDITFIDVGNEPLLPNGFVNFDRMSLISTLVQDFQSFQVPYPLIPVDFIQNSLANLLIFNEEILLKHSLLLEN